MGRIERQLIDLPSAVVMTGAAASSYCLTPDGLGAYLLEPMTPGGRCTASAADADVQQVANLSVR